MAAIVQPHRHPHRPSERPALRLVTGGGRTTAVPVDLGLTTTHLVVAIVAFVAVVLGSLAVGSGALASLAPAPERPSAAAGAESAVSGTVVEVQAGDSIWTVARRLQPSGDVRPLVDRLLAANGSTVLQPGDRLIVPD